MYVYDHTGRPPDPTEEHPPGKNEVGMLSKARPALDLRFHLKLRTKCLPGIYAFMVKKSVRLSIYVFSKLRGRVYIRIHGQKSVRLSVYVFFKAENKVSTWYIRIHGQKSVRLSVYVFFKAERVCK